MALHMFGFNNLYMSAWQMQPLCSNSFNPFNQYGFGCSCFTMSALNPFNWAMPYPPVFNFATQPNFSFQNYPQMPMNYNMPTYNFTAMQTFDMSAYGMSTMPSFGNMSTPIMPTFPQMDFSSMPSTSTIINDAVSYNPFSSASRESTTTQSFSNTSAPSAKRSLSEISSASASSIRPKYTTLSEEHLDKKFLDKVKTVSKKINCDYRDLLAVMNSESSLNPKAQHKNNKGEVTAVGLIQFTKYAAIPEMNKVYGLNLTVEKIYNMSAMEQLDLVEKFYKMNEGKFPKGHKLSAADLYALTFLPGRANREVLCTKGEKGNDGKLLGYYEGNSPLDYNGDGNITKTELEQRVAKKRVNLETFA